MIDLKKFVSTAREKGFTDEQIYGKLYEKGLVKERETAPAQELTLDDLVGYATSIKNVEKNVEERLRKEYELKFKDKIQELEIAMRTESKEKVKKVIKNLLINET